MSNEEITCALTGVGPTEEELDNAGDDIPLGWRRLLIEYRVANPDYALLRSVMAQQEEALIQQAVQAAQAQGHVLTAEQLEMAKAHARIITGAQYRYALDNTPETLPQVEQVVIAPFDRSADGPEARDVFNQLRSTIGLPPIE